MHKLKKLIYHGLLFVAKPLLPLLARIITFIAPDNRAFNAFKKYGFVFLREHYYLPIPSGQEMALAIHAPRSSMIGITFDTPDSIDFLNNLVPKYELEFSSWLVESEQSNRFHIYNGTYMAVDSEMYYTMIRHFKPKRIIEIGSGQSTIVAAEAVEKNKAIDKFDSMLTSIEPYPDEILHSGVKNIPGLTKLIPDFVQNVPLETFSKLEKNDILFIDSTHVLKQGGDVQYIYNEVIPRLRAGVIVHIHDISLPDPYPSVYFDQHFYWNEQYVVQALLTHNARYKILWPGTYMAQMHKDLLLTRFPTLAGMYQRFPQSNPSSLWLSIT